MFNDYHPSLTRQRRYEWQLMRDAMGGESDMKARGTEYLPSPTAFNDDKLYQAYQKRAQFPELLAPSIGAMIGIIHGREIEITMPDAMLYLWENVDGNSLPLEAFHRRITRELLVIGGYSVLADVDENGANEPYLAGYRRDALINWDRDFWVLDETGMVRKGYVWEQLKKYRALEMIDGIYTPRSIDEMGNEKPLDIRGRGNKQLERIPFAVASAMDLSPRIETPPLIGVARAALAMYQLSADYRWQLFMSGQETLVAINGDKPEAVGASAVHEMRGVQGLQPDLKYVSPSCIGIEAHKTAMMDNREAAVMAGARLFEQTGGAQESGEAKKLRYSSETATLVTIAQSSCMLLERSLRNIAMLMGLPEDDIIVHAPTDLMDRTMTPQDFAALFGVYQQGGISWDTLFRNGQQGGIYSAETTADDEQRLIDANELEEPII